MGQTSNLAPRPAGRPSGMGLEGGRSGALSNAGGRLLLCMGLFSILLARAQQIRRAASSALRSCPRAARYAKTPRIRCGLGKRIMTVIIAGGGIGGLTLALSLHQIGIPAKVFESVPALRPLGVGI